MNKLNNATRKAIKNESGITHVKILKVRRDGFGYPDYLLAGVDNSKVEWRGWLLSGEGAVDIHWDCENVDGWPDELQS